MQTTAKGTLNKGRYFTSISVGVAAVWFSSHCGAGFASGTQEVHYFVQHGFLGAILPVFSMTLVGLIMYISLEMSRLYSVFSYIQIANKVYEPIQMVMGKVYDVISLLTLPLAPAACLAGGAVLFNQYFGIPNFFGTLIMLILTVIVCIFGAKFVRMFGSILTIIMIICVAMITGYGIISQWSNISMHFADKVVYTSYPKAIWGAVLYGLFQAGIWSAGASSAVGIRYRNEPKGTAILGIILNSFMLCAVCLMLIGGMPTVATDAEAQLLPTLYVVNSLDSQVFKVIYPLLLFMALVTTAVGFVFAAQARLKLLFFKKMENEKLKNGIIATAWTIIIWIISQVGLIAIISKGYAYTGYINIFTLVIPFFTLGIRNIKRARRLEEAGELPPGVSNLVEPASGN
jgi:uncharacterized membrane protein YkvI